MSPWLFLILISLTWFVSGFLAGWLMDLYQQRQWRKLEEKR